MSHFDGKLSARQIAYERELRSVQMQREHDEYMEAKGELKRCTKCNSMMHPKTSQKGFKYWQCSAVFGHKLAFIDITKPTKPCPKCHETMSLKKGQWGNYWQCGNFTACHHSESLTPADKSKIEGMEAGNE